MVTFPYELTIFKLEVKQIRTSFLTYDAISSLNALSRFMSRGKVARNTRKIKADMLPCSRSFLAKKGNMGVSADLSASGSERKNNGILTTY